MIHATIIEHYPADDSDERATINHALAGTTPEPVLPTGPVRYAQPGEIARTLNTVPVHEAIAALGARIPGAPQLGR